MNLPSSPQPQTDGGGAKDSRHGGKETHLVTGETVAGQAQASQENKNAHWSSRLDRNNPLLPTAMPLLSKPCPKM